MPAHDSPDSEESAVEPPASHTFIRVGLLLGVYLIGLIAPAALSVVGAVYLTAVFTPTLGGVLAMWLLAVIGLAVAPATGRYVLAIGASHVEMERIHDQVSETEPIRSSGIIAVLLSRLAPFLDENIHERD